MAQPSETFDSYDQIGMREDLSDIIYNISPIETPFMSMIGRGKAKNRRTEWQIDTLAAAALNAVIEGDDAINDAIAPTTQVSNITQISDKTIVVSGTADAVTTAGRKKELSYQLAKKGKELKRDMELILTRNQASLVGDATTARTAGTLEAWLTTNVERDATTGLDGGFNTVTLVVDIATDSTATRALTEALLKSVIRQAWTQGGSPTVIMCGAVNKQNISAFTGGVTSFDKSEDKKLVTAIDVYVSDFGTHRVVPNRFQRERTVFCLTPKLWEIRYLRGFHQEKLAKTGDANKRALRVEYSLCSKNEAGSGAVADVTST
jgi:hypothetical protein